MAGEVVALRRRQNEDEEPLAVEGLEGLFLRLKQIYLEDVEKARIWREEAAEDFRFRDGYQWDEAELQLLRDQMRPVITFNRVGAAIDAYVGHEVNNRREVRYIPREVSDSGPNEAITAAADTFRDNCDAEDEETQAHRDNGTAGMGWTELRIDYTDNPDGEVVIDRIDPFEMVWDRNATKSNLADAKQIFRVKKACLRDARKMFPDVEDEELNAAWADFEDERDDGDDHDDRNRYQRDKSRDPDNDNREIVLCCAQYYDTQTVWRAAVLMPGAMEAEIVELPDERFQQMQAAGMIQQAVKTQKRVVMQCWLGASGLLEPPQPTQTGTFTYFPMTGLWDDNKGIFYGIVRRMKDPQRWANKWLSQQMHILNSQAKGGIMVEEGVFEDVRKAQETWARPDSITVLAKNSMSGPGGPRWAEKPVAQFPAGFAQLMSVADENIVKTSGINMELLGMRDANQPGVLEYQRKQSGIAILAPFFDSKRRHLKMQGRGLLHIIQNYLSDGRLIRIVGEENARYVPLIKSEVSGEFDVIVDDSPSSTNEKEKTWQLLQTFLPMVKDALGPEEMVMALEYSPFPTSLVEKIKEGMARRREEQASKPDPQEQAMQMQQEQMAAQMQLEQQKLELEMAKVQADLQKAASDREIALINAETERARISADHTRALADLQRPQQPHGTMQ